jgi:hypothetical protein
MRSRAASLLASERESVLGRLRSYFYSVISAGAYNGADLRAAARNDPLVRERYRDFNLDLARLVVLLDNR